MYYKSLWKFFKQNFVLKSAWESKFDATVDKNSEWKEKKDNENLQNNRISLHEMQVPRKKWGFWQNLNFKDFSKLSTVDIVTLDTENR